jgi:hypothetical protein
MTPTETHEEAWIELQTSQGNLPVARIVGQLLRRNLAIQSMECRSDTDGMRLRLAARGPPEAIRRFVLAFQGASWVQSARLAKDDARTAASPRPLLEATP